MLIVTAEKHYFMREIAYCAVNQRGLFLVHLKGDSILANRRGHPQYGNKYCGNINTKEVHDLDRETYQCHIDVIIAAGHSITFIPDTLDQAHTECYENCTYCLGGKEELGK